MEYSITWRDVEWETSNLRPSGESPSGRCGSRPSAAPGRSRRVHRLLPSPFGFTQIEADTSYGLLIGLLFVMGLGMGATMMPLFTTALRTLTHHEVARGSTLLNITQQIASSVGVAVISVVLTSQLKQSDLALPAIASQQDPAIADQIGGPAGVAQGLAEAADAFGSTYWVAFLLVLLTLIPAYFLPRKREVSHLLDDEGMQPVVLH